MNRFATLLALAAALSVVPLTSCNAVLGIDEASPRDTDQASNLLAVPITSCDGPRSDCGTCIEANCGAFKANCLADHACRKVLNDYRACLGSSCRGSTCFNALQQNALAAKVASCVSDECTSCSGGTTSLVEICELYCGCMQATSPPLVGGTGTCETYVGSQLTWAVGDSAGCVQKCEKLDDIASIHCRWSHCELARDGEIAQHCQHAVDDTRCPLDITLDATCKDKTVNNWGCKKDGDCCSNNCLGNICTE
jgi:hypothetical protein